MKIITTLLLFAGLALTVNSKIMPSTDSLKEANPYVEKTDHNTADKKQQLILWTSGDREVALKMVFMYALNCKKHSWMDNVRLLIWGPSAKLLSEDAELQKYLSELKKAGIELYACKACADMYGVSDKLINLGVTVKYAGKMLADLQKEGWFVLSI
ncbi:MAG: DsrE family protein [Ignavibacteriaceae bacterium]|jgi:hypothetical protein